MEMIDRERSKSNEQTWTEDMHTVDPQVPKPISYSKGRAQARARM